MYHYMNFAVEETVYQYIRQMAKDLNMSQSGLVRYIVTNEVNDFVAMHPSLFSPADSVE